MDVPNLLLPTIVFSQATALPAGDVIHSRQAQASHEKPGSDHNCGTQLSNGSFSQRSFNIQFQGEPNAERK